MSALEEPPANVFPVPTPRYPVGRDPPDAPSLSHGWWDLLRSFKNDSAHPQVECLLIQLEPIFILCSFSSGGILMAAWIFQVISSTLNGLILRTPPKARLHPENSERITAAFDCLFINFFTVMYSKGGRHQPSLRVVMSKIFETAHRANLCSISKSCSQ